jgi:hypothetical protein
MDPFTDGVRMACGPPFIGSTVFTLGDTIFGERHLDLKRITMNTMRKAPVAPQAHPIPIPSIRRSKIKTQSDFDYQSFLIAYIGCIWILRD